MKIVKNGLALLFFLALNIFIYSALGKVIFEGILFNKFENKIFFRVTWTS
jgi:hypothetical protein